MEEEEVDFVYRILHAFLSFCIRLFFGKISIKGEKVNVPQNEAVILAG